MTDLTERPALASLPARHGRPARAAPCRAAGVALAIVLTGQIMAVLDTNIVNVAVPAMHATLGASGAGLQLIVAGYTIAYAVLLVTGARLGDILGHRRVYLAGRGPVHAGLARLRPGAVDRCARRAAVPPGRRAPRS